MNQGIAKYLRKLTEYRNASATPYAREFPGLGANLLRLPVYEKRHVSVRFWDPKAEEYRIRMEKHLVHDARERPVLMPPARKLVDGKVTLVPHEELVARSSPMVVRDNSARGRYRMLKRAVRRRGFHALLATLHNAAMKATAGNTGAQA